MYPTDFEQFGGLLRQLSEVYSKKLTDEMVQAYWDALKDQSFKSVRQLADQHLRSQKFFPKPFELRPQEEKPKVVRDAAAEAAFKEGETRCIRYLEELNRLDPDRHRSEVTVRRLDRLIATTHESSPAYQRIRCEWLEARGLHVGEKEWAEVGGR
jgi:hypothetical protein